MVEANGNNDYGIFAGMEGFQNREQIL